MRRYDIWKVYRLRDVSYMSNLGEGIAEVSVEDVNEIITNADTES